MKFRDQEVFFPLQKGGGFIAMCTCMMMHVLKL